MIRGIVIGRPEEGIWSQDSAWYYVTIYQLREEGTCPRLLRKLQHLPQEIRTRMHCELSWVKLKAEGCKKKQGWGKTIKAR